MVGENGQPVTPEWAPDCRCGVTTCAACTPTPRIPDNIILGAE